MTSPSTLIRKAAKAKSARTAERLRAEAAKLRRDLRAEAKAKHPLPPRAKAKAKELTDKIRSRINEVATRTLDMQPQSEVSGGWRPVQDPNPYLDPDDLERLRHYAREKKRPQDFEIAIRGRLVDSYKSAERKAADETREKLKAMADANRIAVVAAFIATVEAQAARQGGELNPVLNISGYTIARVVEALRLAGYTENGKGAPRRE